MNTINSFHHVVIVGGGFAGLYAAQALGKAQVKVTLIDKRNFHLFQPLLYQVATGSLSPPDIATPIRAVLRNNKNTQVLLGEVIDIDPQGQTISLKDEEQISYDSLILATGASHFYFGNEQWSRIAPGLKTVEDAVEIRGRIFQAFEEAEKEKDQEKRKALLTFVVVGGGPTGVELAGAIAEIAGVLKQDFRQIDTREAEILLLEGIDRVLPPYPPELSAKAEESLRKLGVTVLTKTMVTNITETAVTVKQGDQQKEIAARTVIWAAGVKASKLGEVIAKKTGVKLDRAGKVIVEPDLSVEGYPNLFVVGDLANYPHQGDKPLPGVAPVAMQQGEYVAKLISKKIMGVTNVLPFRYQDLGSLAVIGQNSAVANVGFLKISGFFAWFLWVFAHIYYLIEFDNKLVVMIQWGWNYFTRGRGARLITGENSLKKASDSPQVVKTAGV